MSQPPRGSYHNDKGTKLTGFQRRNKQLLDAKRGKTWHAAMAANSQLDPMQQRMMSQHLLDQALLELSKDVPEPFNLSTQQDADVCRELHQDITEKLVRLRARLAYMRRRQEACRGGR